MRTPNQGTNPGDLSRAAPPTVRLGAVCPGAAATVGMPTSVKLSDCARVSSLSGGGPTYPISTVSPSVMRRPRALTLVRV